MRVTVIDEDANILWQGDTDSAPVIGDEYIDPANVSRIVVGRVWWASGGFRPPTLTVRTAQGVGEAWWLTGRGKLSR